VAATAGVELGRFDEAVLIVPDLGGAHERLGLHEILRRLVQQPHREAQLAGFEGHALLGDADRLLVGLLGGAPVDLREAQILVGILVVLDRQLAAAAREQHRDQDHQAQRAEHEAQREARDRGEQPLRRLLRQIDREHVRQRVHALLSRTASRLDGAVLGRVGQGEPQPADTRENECQQHHHRPNDLLHRPLGPIRGTRFGLYALSARGGTALSASPPGRMGPRRRVRR
jgi:hypothetical protein